MNQFQAANREKEEHSKIYIALITSISEKLKGDIDLESRYNTAHTLYKFINEKLGQEEVNIQLITFIDLIDLRNTAHIKDESPGSIEIFNQKFTTAYESCIKHKCLDGWQMSEMIVCYLYVSTLEKQGKQQYNLKLVAKYLKSTSLQVVATTLKAELQQGNNKLHELVQRVKSTASSWNSSKKRAREDKDPNKDGKSYEQRAKEWKGNLLSFLNFILERKEAKRNKDDKAKLEKDTKKADDKEAFYVLL